MRGEIVTRIAGSRDIFAHAAAPSSSVNFITAHDGFTLSDLVSYEHKHNEANGEDNRDGSNDNHSWNHGVEGPSERSAVDAARTRDQRNLLALLFASRGAPMLSMGSEIGHSQSGNNNAYAQDNAISWLDWGKADLSLYAFTQKLIATRKAHAALSNDAFLTGGPFDASALRDVEWREAEGELTSPEPMAGWRSAHPRRRLRQPDAKREPIASRSSSTAAPPRRIVQLPEARDAHELARADRHQRRRDAGRMGRFA